MTKIKVAVFSGSFAASGELLRELQDCHFGIEILKFSPTHDESELVKKIQEHGAQVIIVGHEPLGALTLKSCPTLRVVLKYGVGMESIDIAAFQGSSVELRYPAGINKVAVAELVLFHLLNHFRGFSIDLAAMKAGTWERRETHSLQGLTLGIVGLGSIGSTVARAVRYLGMKVRFCDLVDRSSLVTELDLLATEYDLLVRDCDVLSFHVPLTPLTKGMFGPSMIELARKRPFIINTSRGGVVDHEAVVNAVCSGILSGYAADVFVREPWKPMAQENHPHLYFTPHIAAHSKEAKLAMGRFCIDALREFLAQGLELS